MDKIKKGVRLDHISKIYQDPKTGKDFYAVHDANLFFKCKDPQSMHLDNRTPIWQGDTAAADSMRRYERTHGPTLHSSDCNTRS